MFSFSLRCTLLLFFILSISSCDPLGRVVRKTVVRYPPDFECVKETLSSLEYVDNLQYRVNTADGGRPIFHTFNYSINVDGEDRFSTLGFDIDNKIDVEVWHGLTGMAFVSPNEKYITSLRPYWEEIEKKISEACNYKFTNMKEECTFAFCK